eukprot:TRINITY_DN43946_c0_g1_i1.p1 TRINITY_DN43946_c0_g1~~TRINITY_DN43946_c0_g1_i1.p1  ORF type:complete len:192 (+),score=34.01 TRINITY_DN43946_c0_g1_i1:198-773(+)
MGQSCSAQLPTPDRHASSTDSRTPTQRRLDSDLDSILETHVPTPSPRRRSRVGVEAYRAFKVTVRLEGEMPLELVVRPFETVGELKRRLYIKHKRARPENQTVVMRNKEGCWEKLKEDAATVGELGIRRADMLRLDENKSAEFESRMEAIREAEAERRLRRDRLAAFVMNAETSPQSARRECVMGHPNQSA